MTSRRAKAGIFDPRRRSSTKVCLEMMPKGHMVIMKLGSN